MAATKSLANALKIVIQPLDLETSNCLASLGFESVPAVPQLVYRSITKYQLPALFEALASCLTETSQAASRFLITRLDIEDQHLFIEFLQAQPLSSITISVRYAWFLRLLLKRQLFFKYQPIFDLNSGQIIAHECLARAAGKQDQFLNGKQLIEAAILTELTCEFDELARTLCIESIAQFNTDQIFFINVLPNAIIRNPCSLEQNLQQILELGLKPQQIVFELTETEIISHSPDIPNLINNLQERGFKIAVDDLCGFVSLDHYVMEFRPDIIKLDRRLVDGCSKYPLKQTLMRSLVHSAKEDGIQVLAEGLEQPADIQFCQNLGVDYGQGFGLGHPELSLKKQPVEYLSYVLSKAS